MPRVGSREWNRQQNLRRQREAEQVVQATPVNPIFNITNEVVIEAEPLECRRDILQLREQLQNKITQIEQHKTNSKEFKKKIKALNKELDEIKSVMNDVAEIMGDLKKYNYMTIDANEDGFYTNFAYEFKILSAKDTELNEEQKKKYDEWCAKGNEGIGKSCVMTGGVSEDKKNVQSYIQYLEALVMSENSILAQVAKGYNFHNFMKKYNGDVEEFRRVCSEDRGNLSQIEQPKCVICNKVCETIYGNNASPLIDGKCCNVCNEKLVIPMRMGKFDVEHHDGFSVIQKK
jgi:DNA repair exonuclease SbcCD ATPase subunit